MGRNWSLIFRPGQLTGPIEKYDPAHGKPAAHPNARFTAPAKQCPVIDSDWENPAGVPISAIFSEAVGPGTLPLVYQSFDWNHGVFMGSIVGSEVTAAAIGLKAGVRRDPFAMLPFCGYHMGDYFGHWVKIGENAPDKNKLPKLFNVNWFRKNSEGKFLWPGYGDNIRVLKWIFERTGGADIAKETAIGYVPKEGSIDTKGLNDIVKNIPELIKVDKNEWMAELKLINEHYSIFGNRLPAEMKKQLKGLVSRLNKL